MVDRAMAKDFSWNQSARQYEEIYRKLTFWSGGREGQPSDHGSKWSECAGMIRKNPRIYRKYSCILIPYKVL